MVDFTTLMNRGHRRFAAMKKKRTFNKCEDCEEYGLLLEYQDPQDSDAKWLVCDYCYKKLEIEEE
jgi:hypothetical protein